MNSEQKARSIVDQMYKHDAFSQWLGIQLISTRPGYCQVQMLIRPEMLNGFQIAHGGICYALADSALAFAANAHGRHSVSVDTQINHLLPLKAGEQVTATAEEQSHALKLGHYQVSIRNEQNQLVALFKGMVFNKNQEWEV